MPDLAIHRDRGPLHELLSDPALERRHIVASAGTVLYEPHAPALNVHLIHTGQVRLYQVGADGATRLFEILGADEWFGVAALANASENGVRAVAIVHTNASEIPVVRLREAMLRRPESLVTLSRELASRILTAREQSAELTFRDTHQRLVNTLLRFARTAASSPREDGDVVLHISHSQLAQAVGAARETVSLALRQLSHQNLVRTGRNQLFFNPATLSRRRGELPMIERVA